jgi:hypothetical protein
MTAEVETARKGAEVETARKEAELCCVDGGKTTAN